ncbi:MAG TPA: hypothetical protein VH724_05955 [Candidatus Angelobacter sp.]|jgi:hypothetical protein|nr:hypothetical protein [Candidatus Angelobacter sp.]
MSSLLIIPIPLAKLARRAWVRLIGLLLLGLLAAAALGFCGYRLHQLNGAAKAYRLATEQYQARTEAIHRLSDMEAAFNRYLLDGNAANQGLLEADRQRIEELGKGNAQNDDVLKNLVALEQKWYAQAVQPLMDARHALAAGQGLPEDFLGKYRNAPQDLQIINLKMAAADAQRQSQQVMQQSEIGAVRWLPIPLAVLLMISMLWLGVGAIKSVNHLKQAAESAGDEEDDAHATHNSQEEAK